MAQYQRQKLVLIILLPSLLLVIWLTNDTRVSLANWRTLPDSWMSDLSEWEGMTLEESMGRRRKRVSRVCEKLREAELRNGNNSTFWPVNNEPDAFFTVEEYKLGYCSNAKVGCSTWKNHLLSLTSLPSEVIQEKIKYVHHSAHRLLSPFTATYKTDLETFPEFVRQEGIFMFSVVRHPFERLVSAYEDKILNHGPGRDKYFRQLVEKIGTDFETFVKFVLKDAKEKGCDNFSCDINHHFRPYFVRCGYCSIEYDAISKMETFSRDTDFILSSVGAAENQNLISSDFHTHSTTGNNSGTNESRTRALKYFQQLDSEIKEALLNLYWVDFEMFGYDPEEYL